MKNLKKTLARIALAATIGLSACKTIEEGVIYKTKEFIGKSEYTAPIQDRKKPNKTLVVTDSTSFVVDGRLDLEPGTWCYVIYDRQYRHGHSKNILYFTWKDTDKKYRIRGRERAFH